MASFEPKYAAVLDLKEHGKFLKDSYP